MFLTFPWELCTVAVYFPFTSSHLVVASFSKGYLRVLRKSRVSGWHSPITSFPQRLRLCYNRFLVVVVVVEGGEVMYFIATCGNVCVQTLLIIPASRECEIPVAS